MISTSKFRAAGLSIILAWGWKRAAIALAAGGCRRLENADSTPAASAMAARFHPQARTIERPTARNLLVDITVTGSIAGGRRRIIVGLRRVVIGRGLAAAPFARRACRGTFLADGDTQALDPPRIGIEHLDLEIAGPAMTSPRTGRRPTGAAVITAHISTSSPASAGVELSAAEACLCCQRLARASAMNEPSA